MQIERILPTDSGKVAFEKTDRNMGFISDGLADRGYDYTKDIGTAHIDTLLNNGKYSGNPQGMPVTGIWCVNVTNAGSWVRQDASCLYDNVGKGFTGVNISRTLMDGVWSSWYREAVNDSTFSDKGWVSSDFNEYQTPGMYYITDNNMSNKPPLDPAYGILEVVRSISVDYILQRATDIINGNTWQRVKADGVWRVWQRIAITTNANVHLFNGWQNFGNGFTPFNVCKSGNVCVITGVISGGTDPTITQLPVGYRPANGAIIDGLFNSGTNSDVRIDIRGDGGVVLFNGAPPTNNALSFAMAYRCE